jgi:hypothetical protein
MKHKVIYLSMACATFILGIALAAHWYFNRVTFNCVAAGDGLNSWEQVWESSDEVTVYESTRHSSSVEDARAALEKELKGAIKIIERKRFSENDSKVGERVIGVFNSQESERSVSIIELRDKGIYRVDAPSLEYAFAFEKYRFEHPE